LICARILEDFVNCHTPAEAGKKLRERLGNGFVISRLGPKEIVRERARLRRLFAEIVTAETLFECESVEDYLAEFNFRIRPFLDLQCDGEIGESQVQFGRTMELSDVLTLCVITLLKDPMALCLIRKCENRRCWNYFISVVDKRKGPRRKRFCSDRCNSAFHNQRRTESGKNRKTGQDGEEMAPL
jgi:hypothetical protein